MAAEARPGSQPATLPSGINQFPAEIFVEIFTLCWHSFTPHFDDIEPPPASFEIELARLTNGPPPDNAKPTIAVFKTEIARLAHAPLLVVSQVCKLWRVIAMGTSSLWCDIQLDAVLWDTPEHVDTATGLLRSTLKRGGTSPLNVELSQMVEHPFPLPVLDVLAAHSERWQKFLCPFSLIDTFHLIKGKLPRLQNLEIGLSPDESESLEIFDPLPNLNTLRFPAPFIADNFEKLPLEYLTAFRCTATTQYETPDALFVMSRLPRATEFRLELYLCSDGEEWLEMDPLPITSNILTFYVQFVEGFVLSHSKVALGSIFANLTLPFLEKLELEVQNYPRFLIFWPHTEFSLALRTVRIRFALAVTGDIRECLSGLHSLERLAISDHQTVDFNGDEVYEHLITDPLLAKLTRRPDSLCLIPRLSSLGCQTFLGFDDRALLTLVVSRLDDSAVSRNAGCFGLELSWLPGHERKIDDAVMAKLGELKISTKRRFRFRISAADGEWV
ncbi:F-box domain-containing protein [Mycena venus]|uniref:F-box domain-containing protein n=1 Tax=Mycena venus TaxID=2733690 RepID=A0A8H7CFG7_9AGAR|nr:F-box domain-containing protein [Mycena venus]